MVGLSAKWKVIETTPRGEALVTFALATTGIAGPTGGTSEKPVGLVYVALAGPQGTEVLRLNLLGDRSRIRQRASLAAINLLRLRLLGVEPKG